MNGLLEQFRDSQTAAEVFYPRSRPICFRTRLYFAGGLAAGAGKRQLERRSNLNGERIRFPSPPVSC